MNDVITSQDKKDEVASASAFSYEVFYRQLGNFLKMLQVMMDSWEDYNSEELAFDIDSLCIKASRLCYMADQDLALQHTDVTHQRKADNEEYHQQMEKLVIKDYSPFVLRVVNSINEGNMMEGHESPMFASDMSSLFPRLFDILEQSGMSREKMLGFQQMFVSVEPIVKGVFPALQSFEQESFEQESSEQESSEQESFEQESFEQESSELGASEFEPVEFEPSERVVELSYQRLSEIFNYVNDTHKSPVSGYIVFSRDSFDMPYSEQSRTYVVSSDNKAYIAGAGGYSIFGSCLDGSDQNIRLERYMRGDNAWKIERCYMQRDDYEYAHSQQVKNKDNREER